MPIMHILRSFHPYIKKPLQLYWWYDRNPVRHNFGDEVSSLIIKKVFGRRVEWASPEECELTAAGSIIEILQHESRQNPIQVWGSGFIQTGKNTTADNLKFCAVRGKISAKRIGENTIALGDPGLLMPRAFMPSVSKTHRVGILPHYADAKLPEVKRLLSEGAYFIDALQPPKEVAKDILSCELVLSSSLHGLILSDAYGVANYWTPFSTNLKGGDYKFKDYYSVYDEEPARKLAHKITQNEKTIDEAIQDYKSRLKKIETIQENLILSFPF